MLIPLLFLHVALLLNVVVLLQVLVSLLLLNIALLLHLIPLLFLHIALLEVLVALLFLHISLLLLLVALLLGDVALLHLLHLARGFGDAAGVTHRTRCDGLCRTTVIGREALLRVLEGSLAKLLLRGQGTGVWFVASGHLGRTRANVYATATAVVADAVVVGAIVVRDVVIDHRAVVDVGVVDAADVGD